jgi:hypothetical protein
VVGGERIAQARGLAAPGAAIRDGEEPAASHSVGWAVATLGWSPASPLPLAGVERAARSRRQRWAGGLEADTLGHLTNLSSQVVPGKGRSEPAYSRCTNVTAGHTDCPLVPIACHREVVTTRARWSALPMSGSMSRLSQF